MKKGKTDEVLAALDSLNLKDYPIDEIGRLMTELGTFGSIIVSYHPGKVIMRARPISETEPINRISDLSYKPQELNKTYQRASTPENTMFYGCTISDKPKDNDVMNNRVIGAFEAVPWLRDKTASGVQRIGYGKWIVHETLNLVAIVFNDDFYKANSYTKELVDGFNDFIDEHPDMKENTIKVTNFLAQEFGKKEINDQSDYLISALFSEIVVNKGFDGILFPSVRLEGRGYNVAITPEAVDAKLQLEVAGECIIYKNKDKIVIDNLTNAKIDNGTEELKLIDVDPGVKAGEALCLESIGVGSIDQLYS